MADRKKSDDFSLVPSRIYPPNTADKELPVQLQTTMTTDREVPGDMSVNQLPGIVDEVEAKLTFHGDEGEVHKRAVNSWTWPAIGVKEDSPFGNIHHGTGANFSGITDNHADSIKLDNYRYAKSLDTTDSREKDLEAGNLGVEEFHTTLVPGGEEKRDQCRKRGLDNGTDSLVELEPKKYKHGSQTADDNIHVCEDKTNGYHGTVGLHQRISVKKEDGQDNGVTVSFTLNNSQVQNVDDGSKSTSQESKSDSEDGENGRCEYEVIGTSCTQNSLQEETEMDLTEVVETDRHVPVAVYEKGNLDRREMSGKIKEPYLQEDETPNSSSGKLAKLCCIEKSASNTTQDESGLHLPGDIREQLCSNNVPPCSCIGIGITEIKAHSLQSGECRTTNGAASIRDAEERSEDNSIAVVPIHPERSDHIHDENDVPTANEDDMFVSCHSQCLEINKEDVTGKSEEPEKRLFVTNSSNFGDSELDMSEGLVDKTEISVANGVAADVVEKTQKNKPALGLSPSLALCQNDVSSVPNRQENKVNVTELDDTRVTMVESSGMKSPSPFACQSTSKNESNEAMTDMTNAEKNSALKKFPQRLDNRVERSLTTTENYFFKMLGHNSRNTVGFQEERKVNPGIIFSDQTSIPSPDVCLLNAEMERNCLNHNHSEKVVDVTSPSEKVSDIIDLLLSMVVEEVLEVKDSGDMETNCGETSSSVTSNEKRDVHLRATVYPSDVCVKSPRLHVQVMEQIDELPEVEEHESCVCPKRKGRWECVYTTDDGEIYDGEMATPLEMLPTPNCSQPESSAYSKIEHLLCCMESLPLDETEDEDDIPMLPIGHCPVFPLEEFSCSPDHTPLHKHLLGPSDNLRPNWTGVKIQQWDCPSREESESKVIEENSMDTSPVLDEQSCRMNVDYQLTADSVRESEKISTTTDSQRHHLQAVTNNTVEQGCLARPELEKRTTTSASTLSYCSSGSSIDEVDETLFRSSSSYIQLISRDRKKHIQGSVEVAVSNNNEELCVDNAALVFNDEDEKANNFVGSICKVKCIVTRAASPCSNSQSGMPNEETVPNSNNIYSDSHSELSLIHNKDIHGAETSAAEDDIETTKEGMSVNDHCDECLEESSHKCRQGQSTDITTKDSTCMFLPADYNLNLGKAGHNEDTAHVCTGEKPSNVLAVQEEFHKGMNANSNDLQMANHLSSKDTRNSGDVSTASTSLIETTSEKENLPAMFSHENTAEKSALCDATTPVSHKTPMGYHVGPEEPSCCDVMDQTVPDEEVQPLHYNREHTVPGIPGMEADTGTLYAETSTCHDGKSSSLFYWSHQQRISYTEQLVPTKADMSLEDSSSCGVLGVSPLKTCSRPIRVGLSRRQRVQKLHPYNKPKE